MLQNKENTDGLPIDNQKKTHTPIYCREPKEPTTRNWQQTCLQCNRTFYSVRKDAHFCSTLCRVHYFRGEKESTIERQAEKIIYTAVVYSKDWEKSLEVHAMRDFAKNKLGIDKYKTNSFAKFKDFLTDWNNEHPGEPHYMVKREKDYNNEPIVYFYEIP